MAKPSATATARSFLAILWADEPPTDTELLAAVDRLLAAVHEVPYSEADSASIDPPERDWASMYKAIAARFPTFGSTPSQAPSRLERKP